ncbi:hypothetical protein [Streptomyces sp. NPDC046985]
MSKGASRSASRKLTALAKDTGRQIIRGAATALGGLIITGFTYWINHR